MEIDGKGCDAGVNRGSISERTETDELLQLTATRVLSIDGTMASRIPIVPELPKMLRDAAFRGVLIPFVGAGASVLAGCPTWGELADDALKHFIGTGHFTYAQFDQIERLPPRVKLSIALGLQEKHEALIDFGRFLHPPEQENHESNQKGQRLYTGLSGLGRTFVTTNYDKWLDESLAAPYATIAEDAPASPGSRRVLFRKTEFTAANLNQENTVIHLHGSVSDPGGMIVSTRDYVAHYRNDRRGEENPVLTFLENLFRNKHVLFVGYSLQELEILEYVMLKAGEDRIVGSQPRHFMLQGFFSHEFELMQNLRDYYEQCGIKLLPFSRDHKDRDQLIEVVEEFAAEISVSPLMKAQEFQEMKKWLE